MYPRRGGGLEGFFDDLKSNVGRDRMEAMMDIGKVTSLMCRSRWL
jgi:hypothetical protein